MKRFLTITPQQSLGGAGKMQGAEQGPSRPGPAASTATSAVKLATALPAQPADHSHGSNIASSSGYVSDHCDVESESEPEMENKVDEARPKNNAKKAKFDNKEYDHKVRHREFKQHWRTEFPWLKYDEGQNIMYCSPCKQFPNLSNYTTPVVSGTSNFRVDPLRKHQKSMKHQACVNKQCQQDEIRWKPTTSTSIGRGILAMNNKNRERLSMLFNTAYGLTKKNRPFTDYQTVCTIQKKNGLDIGDTHITDKTAQQMISAVAKVISQGTADQLRESRFVTVMADGSTDTTITEQEVVYVRYVYKGTPLTKLASIQPLEHGNAEGVFAGIIAGLQQLDLSIKNLQPKLPSPQKSFPTLVCANFDGASVMMGNKTGVATRFKDVFPWVIPVHCVAHKLELGILDGIKGILYLDNFEKTVKKIFLFYHYSPKRRRELTEISKVLEEDILQYGAVKSVRWVASKSRALKALSRNLGSTYTHTEHASANNRNADEVGKALAIKRAIQTLRFVKYLHLMQDFLAAVVATSKCFQLNALLIMEVPSHIDQLVLQLKALNTNPGKHMTDFYQKLRPDGTFGDTRLQLSNIPNGEVPTAADYHTDKDVCELIDKAVVYITERFKSSHEPPLSHFNAFNFTI